MRDSWIRNKWPSWARHYFHSRNVEAPEEILATKHKTFPIFVILCLWFKPIYFSPLLRGSGSL